MVMDAGDIEVYSGEVQRSCAAIEEAVAIRRDARRGSGDPRRRSHHHLAGRHRSVPSPRRRPRVGHSLRRARRHRQHHLRFALRPRPADAAADRVRCRAGDRFLQLGLRGYWPEPETLDWMADQGMNSFHMSEIVARGLDAVLDQAFHIALDECHAVFLSVDVDVCDPGHAPGTGTPEPGGTDVPAAARRGVAHLLRAAGRGRRRGRGVTALRPCRDHRDARQSRRAGSAVRHGTAQEGCRDGSDGPWDRATPLLKGRGTGSSGESR